VSQESLLETDLEVESQDHTNSEMYLEDNMGSEVPMYPLIFKVIKYLI
jgi:hypothetical protein